MLFNSHEFIFVFLPLTLLGYYLIGGRLHHRMAVSWLVFASLLYYAWWNPAYVSLIVFSMLFNYSVGLSLVSSPNRRRGLLTMGIVANLALLGYFKYANFFLDTVNQVADTSFHAGNIILPLAISFFTFQQIAYLVDSYEKKTREYNFLNYALFVTFFPQLIAGPIVHHREMLSQFAHDRTFRWNPAMFEQGLAFFSIGLFKKVIIADNVAQFSTPLFNAALTQPVLSVADAWIGALAYSFQLYFDFSAYSDMAIGAALMFGIRLPVNFASPYKATSIIDFWSRWHITLSRFLRDYLYIPLGGNRGGNLKRYRNLIVTMLLGGLWHGAGWTFVIWGGLHGFYLMVNHAWRAFRKARGKSVSEVGLTGRVLSTALTFLAVLVAWVFFRAETFDSAMLIIHSMFGLNPQAGLGPQLFAGRADTALRWFLALAVVVWAMPNLPQWMDYRLPDEDEIDGRTAESTRPQSRWAFRANVWWALFATTLLITAVLNLTKASEFLYFQF